MSTSGSFLSLVLLAIVCLCYAKTGSHFDGQGLVQRPQRVHYGSLDAKTVRGLFHKFVTDHKRVYADNAEAEKRFKIFTENLKRYDDFNANDRGTAVYGIDQFSDMSVEEFRQKFLTLNVAAFKESSFETLDDKSLDDLKIPKNFDWRKEGAVTPVKNQGYCGSCWAFSAVGNMEGLYFKKHKKLMLFSEQQLVDCDKESDGCDGGWMSSAVNSVKELGGLQTAETYPYVGVDQTCKFNKSLAVLKVKDNVMLPVRNEKKMARYTYKNGPISVALDASAMFGYLDGVAHPDESYCHKNETKVNHGVTLIGYGVQDVKSGGKRKKTIPFWILKNSWGEKWGFKGYYLLFRGDSTCAIDSYPSSAILE